MPVIDAHVHLQNPAIDLPEIPLFEGFSAPFEQLIADHERHGIDGAVFVPMDADERNLAYCAEAVDEYSGQAAIIGIQPDVDDQVERYRSDVEQYDIEGWRVTGLGGTLDDPENLDVWPLFEEMADHGHCLWMYPHLDEYDLVDTVAERLPNLNVVYNLLGFPHPGDGSYYERDEHGLPRITRWDMPADFPEQSRETLLHSGARENTYVLWGVHWQYSSEDYPYADLAEHGRDLVEAFGTDHVAFMTDWPWMVNEPGYESCLDMIEEHFSEFSAAERDQIRGGTAAELFEF